MRMPLDWLHQCDAKTSGRVLGCMFGVFSCAQASGEGPAEFPERCTAHGYECRVKITLAQPQVLLEKRPGAAAIKSRRNAKA